MKKLLAASVAAIFLMTGCGSEASEPEKISTEKVAAAVETNFSLQDLIINTSPAKYSYENFIHDVEILRALYPNQIQVLNLCTTPDGRQVVDIILGDINGDNQILIFGAMHAREYITMQIVMRQLCETLNPTGASYRGVPAAELLQGVTIHFVPDSNPDGVAISQFGLNGIKNPSIRNSVAAMTDDFEQWKSNANGVDLNRNFDAGWHEYVGSTYPGSERYKGTSPGSEPEAAALIRLTQDYHIKRAISYHTCGAVIYWYYKQSGSVLAESKKFAEEISSATNYPLDDDYTALDAAGYKDWAVYKLGVPSITIEVGAETGGLINPVPQSRFGSIWERNKNVVLATAYNLKFK